MIKKKMTKAQVFKDFVMGKKDLKIVKRDLGWWG
uniref:Uncharacterized protein n=1 Tax=Rhizophora mucronata TaxID=61149 RepID=A0A2P2NEX9_RHIMU